MNAKQKHDALIANERQLNLDALCAWFLSTCQISGERADTRQQVAHRAMRLDAAFATVCAYADRLGGQ